MARHHLFGKAVLKTDDGVQVRALLHKPERHVDGMLGIDNVVGRSDALAHLRENLAEKGGIRLHYRNFDFGTLAEKFPYHRHATRRMPQPPIQRGYKYLHRASSQAFAQSPWSQSLLSPISIFRFRWCTPVISTSSFCFSIE